MTTQKAAGVYKGVSEPVYPDDILADQELQGAPPEVRGIWCANILPVMWRDKRGTIEGQVDAFARNWGVSVPDAERIIDDIETHKIGVVSRECPGIVSITCRRLQRKEIYRVAEREKKRSQRCPDTVPTEKVLPPSPSPSPSPSPLPSPVPIDKGEGEGRPSPTRPVGAGVGSAGNGNDVPGTRPLHEFIPEDRPLRKGIIDEDSLARERHSTAERIAFESISRNKIIPGNRPMLTGIILEAEAGGLSFEVIESLLKDTGSAGRNACELLSIFKAP